MVTVLIAEGDYLANLLPAYGHFTGEPHQGTPPTGNWLEYGVVNTVRFEGGKSAEAWFGMDPLVEMQHMGAAPALPPRQLSAAEVANVELFWQTINTAGLGFDNLTAFGDALLALGPPQHAEDTTTRHTLGIMRQPNPEFGGHHTYQVCSAMTCTTSRASARSSSGALARRHRAILQKSGFAQGAER